MLVFVYKIVRASWMWKYILSVKKLLLIFLHVRSRNDITIYLATRRCIRTHNDLQNKHYIEKIEQQEPHSALVVSPCITEG